MQLHDMICDLCSISAPSGFEERAFLRISELLTPFVDDIHSDALGNLIAVKKCGKPNAEKLLLNAHMDEIGLIVTGYEKGFLRFSLLGGVDPRMLPALELKILTTPPIFGVIDTLPPHVLTAEERDKSVEAKKLFIDVGLSDEDARAKIPLGTPVVFAGGCEAFADKRVCGKSLDDRACVAILIKTMQLLNERSLDVDVYCLISTQEEVGMRGAVTGAFGIEPNYAVTVDVTHADTPDSKKHETMKMGKGVAIGVGPNMSRRLTTKLTELAEKHDIPYQIEVMSGCSGTDAWVIQVSRTGVETAVLSLPVKYMHSPVELADINDAEAVVRLLTEFTSF